MSFAVVCTRLPYGFDSHPRALGASFTLEFAQTRVRIVVRPAARSLHVVALCDDRQVELVRRALRCVDAHFRAYRPRVPRQAESLRAAS